MACSHSGEDLRVRDEAGAVRRAGVSPGGPGLRTRRGCRLDALTAAGLARDGERPSPIRHKCSGQHSVFLLLRGCLQLAPRDVLAREHPPRRRTGARSPGRTAPAAGRRTAVDDCGVLTYAFP